MMQEKDNYLVLVATYLNHMPLLMVTSSKVISFRVCDSAVLSWADKESSTFSALYSSSSKGSSGPCEATELYERSSHHEGTAFTNALQIAENQIKGTAKCFYIIYSLWEKNLVFYFLLIGFSGFGPNALFLLLPNTSFLKKCKKIAHLKR